MGARLAGKVALVTGAASGIGRATTELFAEEGAEVLACDILDERGEALAARFPGQVRYRRCDVTDAQQIEAAVAACAAEFGGLDILFNNAGAGGSAAMVEDVSPAAFDATVALLLRSVVLGTRYATPLLKARGGGAIVNTASAAAILVGLTPFTYAVCKAAVVQFTKAAAVELAVHNIRINALCPGVIATPIWGKLRPDTDLAVADQAAAMIAHLGPTMQPLPKAGLPEDVAQACLWLASPEAAFVTGHALVVDGALTLSAKARTPETLGAFMGMSGEDARQAYLDAIAAERARYGE